MDNETIKLTSNDLFDEKLNLSAHDYNALPSVTEICAILKDLKDLYCSRCFFKTPCTVNDVETKLGEIYDRLLKQIEYAFCYEAKTNELTPEIAEKSKAITLGFVKKFPEIAEILLSDVKAILDGDPAARTVDIILLTYPGFEAIFTYRLAHVLFVSGVPLIPRIMTETAHSKTGVDIHPGATIGKCFVIDHGTGIVIGETTEIGDYVKLYQGVTLGAISLKNSQALVGKKRHPTIENNVTIYAGATILGGQTVIGEGAVIGSSVFITESVEKGMTVIIEKPKLRLYKKNPI